MYIFTQSELIAGPCGGGTHACMGPVSTFKENKLNECNLEEPLRREAGRRWRRNQVRMKYLQFVFAYLEQPPCREAGVGEEIVRERAVAHGDAAAAEQRQLALCAAWVQAGRPCMWLGESRPADHVCAAAVAVAVSEGVARVCERSACGTPTALHACGGDRRRSSEQQPGMCGRPYT